MSYTGETAYITGGASGIGRYVATALAKKGMKIFIADRNLEGALETAKALNKDCHTAWAVKIDVEDWESQRGGFGAAVKELGRIDYVFAVAGIFEQSWLPNRVGATTFEKPNLTTIDVNGTGVMYTSALAIQQFRRQAPSKYGFRGKIIIVSSGASFYSIPAMPIYCASKNAVVGFVRTMGKLVAEEQMTLNAICPGIVRTAISGGSFHDIAEEKGVLVSLETIVSSFESLLGTNPASGDAIEVMPGQFLVKPGAEFTNEKCEESVILTYKRTMEARAKAS